jgi:type II restriction enzyme
MGCIPILLAVREKEIEVISERGDRIFNFKKQNHSMEEYLIFMEKSGLFNLISKHIIRDLVDYVLGVEVGLDSNARKNRTGKAMEGIVESYLKKAGVEYYKEMGITQIKNKWGLDLSKVSGKDKAEKRFDFVVKTSSQIYGIEVNFYGSGGSKLNETARSYKMLNSESRAIDGFTFIWITDGKGWESAKSNLKETFDEMDYIYCIKELDERILEKIFRK